MLWSNSVLKPFHFSGFFKPLQPFITLAICVASVLMEKVWNILCIAWRTYMCVNKEYRRICVADLMCGIWYVYAVCVKLPTEESQIKFWQELKLEYMKM